MPDHPQNQHFGTPGSHPQPTGAHPDGARRRRVAASIDLAATALRSVRARTGTVVLTDRPCRQCGYNLRGLDTGAACPECGSPVARGTEMPPDVRDALLTGADTLEGFGRSHLANGLFVLFIGSMVLSGSGCGIGLAAALVGIGCLYRLVTVRSLARTPRAQSAAMESTLRAATTACTMETVAAFAFIAALAFDMFAWLPPEYSPLAINVAITAWGGVIGLGMIASSLLADVVSRQYELNVTRSMLPLRAAIAAPVSFAACVIACECHARFPESGFLLALAIGTLAASAAAWLLAAWAACAYLVGTADAMRAGITPKRAPAPVRLTAPPAPPPTTDKARAARKLLDDDSPIPMD